MHLFLMSAMCRIFVMHICMNFDVSLQVKRKQDGYFKYFSQVLLLNRDQLGLLLSIHVKQFVNQISEVPFTCLHVYLF